MKYNNIKKYISAKYIRNHELYLSHLILLIIKFQKIFVINSDIEVSTLHLQFSTN